jgi:hypothetical protein
MRIQNMTSTHGNPVPNQFKIVTNGLITSDTGENLGSGTMFQSYKSNIVYKNYRGQVYLDSYYWDYSKTTGKYRNLFLGEDKKATEKKIASGEYKLINLN